MVKWVSSISALLLISMNVLADVSTLSAAEQRSANTQSNQTTSHEQSIEQNAQAFGVTSQEWTRYQSIMSGEGKYHWKDADPVVVLGIYSKNSSERKRYAEMMARKEYDLNKRFIEFNQEYVEAFQRLYGNEPIMDITKVAAFQNQFQSDGRPKPKGPLSLGDRIVLFVSTDCSSCDAYFKQIKEVQEFSSLDIYFINDSASDITHWAKAMGITPSEVKSGVITLNTDDGMYARYGRPGLPASFYFNNHDQSVSAFVPE